MKNKDRRCKEVWSDYDYVHKFRCKNKAVLGSEYCEKHLKQPSEAEPEEPSGLLQSVADAIRISEEARFLHPRHERFSTAAISEMVKWLTTRIEQSFRSEPPEDEYSKGWYRGLTVLVEELRGEVGEK